MARVNALNVSWNYSWNTHHISEQPKDIEFVPMIWTGKDLERVQERLTNEVLPDIKAGKSKRLLGFNEPDQKEQSNIPYTLALELWPALEKLNIPLCSPACANPEGIKDEKIKGVPGTWMRDFMQEADKRAPSSLPETGRRDACRLDRQRRIKVDHPYETTRGSRRMDKQGMASDSEFREDEAENVERLAPIGIDQSADMGTDKDYTITH